LFKSKEVQLPFSFTEVRKWWYKDKEIDVVVLNEQTKQILFVECKWKERVNPRKIFNELKEKSQHVRWHNEERKEYYAIFAKSFKKRIEEKNLMLFDLRDLENVFR